MSSSNILNFVLKQYPKGDLFIGTLVDLYLSEEHHGWVSKFINIPNTFTGDTPFIISVNLNVAVQSLEMSRWTTFTHILAYSGFILQDVKDADWMNFVYVHNLDMSLTTVSPQDRRFWQFK
jgi:hypothetical protein